MKQTVSVIAAVLITAAVHGRVYNTLPRALKSTFMSADKVKRKTFYLTSDQLAKARKLNNGRKIKAGIIHQYRVIKDGGITGYVYLDSHRVRTFKETLFIALNKDGTVKRIEVLSFAEPPEYIPGRDWFNRFNGKGLEVVRTGDHLPVITGSTLSTEAVQRAVTRVIAIHRSIN